MSDTYNFKWKKIDKDFEDSIVEEIRFIRPIDSEPINLSCLRCKILISSIEDVEEMKEQLKKIDERLYELQQRR